MMYCVVKVRGFEDLDPDERVLLAIICEINNLSLKAHTSPEKILRRIRGRGRKYAKKSLHALTTNGFVARHPTRGGITLQLTKKGQVACKKLLDL